MRARWFWISVGVVIGTGVVGVAGWRAAIHPVLPSSLVPTPLVGKTFPHAMWDVLLRQHVDSSGRVDYETLHANSAQLQLYYHLVTRYSPDSHPDLFPDKNSRLCYWINAYNAAVLATVLEHYPIESVIDVTPPWYVGFLPTNSGFFLLQEPLFGGKPINLYDVEHQVVRPRFQEPRIHFALNCASRGCPRLPREAFHPDRLDAQLNLETRLFFSEKRNLAIDHAAKKIWMSSLLQWYEGDFVSKEVPTLVDFAARYLDKARAKELKKARDAGYKVEFIPYDWRLNDQASGR